MQLCPGSELITAGLKDGQAFADGKPDVGGGRFVAVGREEPVAVGRDEPFAGGREEPVAGGCCRLVGSGVHPTDGSGSDDHGSCCQEQNGNYFGAHIF